MTLKPSGFAVANELGEPGADTESWIKFDTSIGRGIGHLRLREGKAWTLLTTLNELIHPFEYVNNTSVGAEMQTWDETIATT